MNSNNRLSYLVFLLVFLISFLGVLLIVMHRLSFYETIVVPGMISEKETIDITSQMNLEIDQMVTDGTIVSVGDVILVYTHEELIEDIRLVEERISENRMILEEKERFLEGIENLSLDYDFEALKDDLAVQQYLQSLMEIELSVSRIEGKSELLLGQLTRLEEEESELKNQIYSSDPELVSKKLEELKIEKRSLEIDIDLHESEREYLNNQFTLTKEQMLDHFLKDHEQQVKLLDSLFKERDELYADRELFYIKSPVEGKITHKMDIERDVVYPTGVKLFEITTEFETSSARILLDEVYDLEEMETCLILHHEEVCHLEEIVLDQLDVNGTIKNVYEMTFQSETLHENSKVDVRIQFLEQSYLKYVFNKLFGGV